MFTDNFCFITSNFRLEKVQNSTCSLAATLSVGECTMNPGHIHATLRNNVFSLTKDSLVLEQSEGFQYVIVKENCVKVRLMEEYERESSSIV